jgi:hypothetical protein
MLAHGRRNEVTTAQVNPTSCLGGVSEVWMDKDKYFRC